MYIYIYIYTYIINSWVSTEKQQEEANEATYAHTDTCNKLKQLYNK